MKLPLPLYLYNAATRLGNPLIHGWLVLRRWRGKEDVTRFHERFGTPSRPRPEGQLIWCHAASVGEMMSVLHLLKSLRTQRPDIQILLTTGTVTSARLAAGKLPEGVFHQYAPIDTADSIDRFLNFWQPCLALWLESELWPHMLLSLKARSIPALLVNGRMSERSARRWAKWPRTIRTMLGSFSAIYAGSDADANRYRSLTPIDVYAPGNLKYDAPTLPADATALAALSGLFGNRPVWCAASTHPGEEEMVIAVHQALSAEYPNLLTVIAPRHPERGLAIAELIESKGLSVARRSAGEGPSRTTPFFLADTMGELGNLFRLCQIVFMGGSLTKRGGHNLIEPARLGCAPITGPYTHNFTDILHDFLAADAVTIVQNTAELADAIRHDLQHADARTTRAARAQEVVNTQSGATRVVQKHVLQLLPSNEPPAWNTPESWAS